MKGLAYKVSYNQSYRGFQRDSRPALIAMVAADMKVFIPVANLLMWSGDIRYRQMLGLDAEAVGLWGFRWYEYLDSRIYNQVRATLWLLVPEYMAEEEAWEE